MRLLIVEDEFYTRQGIVEDLDLASIGFDDIRQADDGVDALEIARSFPPDIVLADVRMPRMDGITMSFALRKSFPRCHIVVMSGHSDKEYLKAAIELSAVSYIEKPFRSRELKEVLLRAATLHRQEEERDRREAALQMRAEAGAPLLRSEVALMLVQQQLDDSLARQMLAASGIELAADAAIAVAVIRPAGTSFTDELSSGSIPRVEQEIARSSVGGLVALKGNEEAIIVLHAPPDRARSLEKNLGGICAGILPSFGPAVIGISPVVPGLAAARAAYLAGSSALDAAFFCGPGTIAFDASTGRAELPVASDAIDSFQACLDREDGAAASAMIRALAESLCGAGSRDAWRARDLLTRMLLRFSAFAERKGLGSLEGKRSLRSMADAIERAGTLSFIADLMIARIDDTFALVRERASEGRVVTDIKRSVHRGFARPGLSIDDIAREVGLSAAHICRLFKEATGETIHRYITAYRLERARDLLADPRLPKMTEVAARAGFADANYFARSFRKETGLSPSEFRDKALR